jgi:hypothetical protein
MEIVTCPNCGKKTPKEMESIISYSFIIEKFKKMNWNEVDNFEDMLEFYLENKKKILENVKIKDMNRWLAQIIIALEIARVINPERFEEIYKEWQSLIGRKWIADIENEVVTWIN